MQVDDVLDGVPNKKLFGYQLKTKTQILLSYLIPTIIELCIYVILTVADVALIVQHFRDNHAIWAILTLIFVVLPAILCFITIITSPSQWPGKWKLNDKQENNNNNIHRHSSLEDVNAAAAAATVRRTTDTKCNKKSLPSNTSKKYTKLTHFRYARKIFWSVEALFHDKNNNKRYHAVLKANETSSFELYHFLQAFTQAAPQIMLQLYIVMHESVFRNYETTVAQSLSIIFSFLKMGVTCMTYHRFESQHVVGRQYPWLNSDHVKEKVEILRRSTSRPAIEIEKKTESAWTPIIELNQPDKETNEQSDFEFQRKSFYRTENSKRIRRPSYEMLLKNMNITDDDKMEFDSVQKKVKIDLERPSTSKFTFDEDEIDTEVELRNKSNETHEIRTTNMPDDDILDHIHDMKTYLREQGDDVISSSSEKSVEITNFDRSPSLPPPPRPTSLYLPPFVKLTKLKDMLIFDAQNLIKTHVPHLPPGLFEDNKNNHKFEQQATTTTTIITPNDDTTDFIQLPTRKRTINGLEQDDIFGKYICFLAWFLFLIMRMLALSTFTVFYLRETIFLCLAHYFIMLLCLYCETRTHAKLNRTVFYAFLAYIYIFCLIEFKIKFLHIKTWYVGYFLLVFMQNLIITMIWYLNTDILLFSWWLQFMWYLIIGSGTLSLLCHIFYYFTLRPRDKVLFVHDDDEEP
uniref:XK-related protein n=1 Tax=Culicoides sonorensis TaxID=179676 RepID=A0A336LRI3_CULSO